MLRKLFARHRIEASPFVKPDETRGLPLPDGAATRCSWPDGGWLLKGVSPTGFAPTPTAARVRTPDAVMGA